MPIARSINDVNQIVDWTQEILDVPNQYGWVKNQGIFSTRGTPQTAIVFDKMSSETTLLPQTSRRQRNMTYGKDRAVDTFSLPLAYFKHGDAITPADIQDQRRPGDSDLEETLDRVRSVKLTDMRRAVDQTHEYIMVQAIKGVTTTPDGATIADMFTEFSVSQPTIDFILGTGTTNVDAKVAELKRTITKNALTGGMIGGIQVIVDESWFDKFKSHPKVKEAYLNWQSNQRYRDDISEYMSWGISDVFDYQGVRFLTYPAEFILPDGTTEKAIATDEGHAIPRITDLFRGYYGPSNKLSQVNQAGSEMFSWEYRDQKDEAHEMEVETSPLFFCTKPKTLVKVTTSN